MLIAFLPVYASSVLVYPSLGAMGWYVLYGFGISWSSLVLPYFSLIWFLSILNIVLSSLASLVCNNKQIYY